MADKRTFHVYPIVRTAAEFEKTAALAKRLKKHGPVEMMVGSLAEPTRADMPGGGSAWHEYASYLPTWRKFFPHPKMAPFLDMKHVKRNRALLAGCVKVLQRYGYGAALVLQTPYFLPEEFFGKYPHLRGARVDHPRRTRREAFALCVDHPETLEMYADMSAQMARDIPQLTALRLVSNDAGSGLCWADVLYPGPNGPAHCKNISTAQRVGGLVDAIRRGYGKNKPLDILSIGNYSDAELRELRHFENDLLRVQQHGARHGHPYQIATGSMMDNPVLGVFDPVGIIKSLQRLRDPAVKRVSISFRIPDNRGQELLDVQEKVIEVVDAFATAPAYGAFEQMSFLRKLCGKWVGEKKKDDLLEALVAMNDAYTLKRAAVGAFTSHFCGVTMRAINRPLVIMPELLTPAEQSYFLPYVFNPNPQEANTDYLDWHGGKLVGAPVSVAYAHSDPRMPVVDKFRESLQQIAGTLEQMGTSAAGEVFGRMGMSLRIYACTMRSVNNMFGMGTLRDRNREKLAGPPHIPPKVGDWTGDPELQLMNGIMRDELDNAVELIGLLENGGKRQLHLAKRAEDEDTFVLGPGIIGTLRKKCAIMRKHWLDVEAYMSTPHK